jgi:archaellum component FlaC
VLRAVELLGNEIGMFKERTETKIDLSDEELEAQIRRLEASPAELGASLPTAKEGKLDV